MDLGRATLRGNGLNLLKNGIHPRHGLVWTDGKTIYLAPIRLYGNDVENAKSLKLGEFDNVRSLHWSSDVDADTCYLCAIHEQNVTVWKVTGSAPKLGFKQARKINVQPIPQGCLWHPSRDTLCLLSRNQCSFYFKHGHNKSSFAFPQLESGKVTCGTWSEDGQKLAVCVGSIVLLYAWSDVDSALADFTPAAWKVPRLDSNIVSILPISLNSMVLAAELPLESLCKQPDMFVVPDVVRSSKDGLMNGSQGDVIRPSNGQTSIKDSLLHLQRNPQSFMQDTSRLVVFKLDEKLPDPTVVTATSVRGILVPDVLAHEPKTNSVIVGSNNQNMLQIFTCVDENLVKVSDIVLEKHQRPKGSCQVPAIFAQTSSGILVMVGEKDPADVAFPSKSNESKHKLRLKYFPIKIDKTMLRSSYSTMPRGVAADVNKSEQKIKSLSSSNLPSQVAPPRSRNRAPAKQDISTRRENLANQEDDSAPLKISLPQSQSSPREPDSNKLVVDMNSNGQTRLETETVQFSNQPAKFQNSHVDTFFNNKDSLDGSVNTVPSNGFNSFHSNGSRSLMLPATSESGCVMDDSLSDPGNSSSIHSEDGVGCEVLERQVKSQKEQIAALQKKIDLLSQVVEDTSCIFPTKYQNPERPDKVKIMCESSTGPTTRSFLLDAGRLQLEPIKQAFRLATVELIIDDEPCVLGSNIDGYIPMKFTPGATLQITGIPACNTTESPRDKLSNNAMSPPDASKC